VKSEFRSVHFCLSVCQVRKQVTETRPASSCFYMHAMLCQFSDDLQMFFYGRPSRTVRRRPLCFPAVRILLYQRNVSRLFILKHIYLFKIKTKIQNPPLTRHAHSKRYS